MVTILQIPSPQSEYASSVQIAKDHEARKNINCHFNVTSISREEVEYPDEIN
jgi:hypothetical protein